MRLTDTRRPDKDDIFPCRYPIQSYQFSDDTRIQRRRRDISKSGDRGLEGKMCLHLRQFDAIGIAVVVKSGLVCKIAFRGTAGDGR